MNSQNPIRVDEDAVNASSVNPFYFAAWRWHFYAGLYVIPFFIMLAITGLGMLWIGYIDGRDGEHIAVVPQEAALSISAQSDAALASIPGGTLKQYIAPRSDDLAAIFRIDIDGDAKMVVVDPYTAEVLDTFSRRAGWYDFMDNLHSDIMIGFVGDRMIEIAASLGMVLVVTGLYMWWPRGEGGWRKALIPSLGRGRTLWKSLHGTVGIWISVFLVFFLISGLAWTGIWGSKMTQSWSQFPAEKWDNVPLSDQTHASLNHDRKEVPWALELTPLPASGSMAGVAVLESGTVLDINTMDMLARKIGFEGRYQMNLPKGETGVWTFSRDSMNSDSTSPTADRTVHVDQYTGKILADARYEDYSWAGKAMAVGIALHMGLLGLWSVLANTVFCLAVLFLSISSLVLWWKRRPSRAGRIGAPPAPANMPLWQGAVLVGAAISIAFPLAGITLVSVLALDYLILSRISFLKRALS
ncbi:PepSY domain-containing protein [Amylibacter sp. SFDW26]|uniref:PepSY-associated TM helix domain-containing protein n=1 Tax=Amylibacter sp. SFDW26 TaxID=2652722 RepID=UPI0012618745|nr:PepSY domain-containing protein [Amylibacter sp. SFDW26]KAB7610395.1 PepSY domain-containing protein [Amylibacter sp. SFDW26]